MSRRLRLVEDPDDTLAKQLAEVARETALRFGPYRRFTRWRLERAARVIVPWTYRPLFEGAIMPPPPPTPKMLRECANILDTAPYMRHGEAEWLRELAFRLPDPYEYREHFTPRPLFATCGHMQTHELPFMCSLERGHAGEHQAIGMGGDVVARWPA